jgi:hypothetical protein
MAHSITGYKASLAIWFHHYIQTRQISQDMDKFISQILLKATTKQLENQLHHWCTTEEIQRLDEKLKPTG